MSEFPPSEGVEAQFSTLMEELVSATMHRARFQPWEMEILLDIESCNLTGGSRRRVLRDYEQAVMRHFASGARLPFKLSAYLEARQSKPSRKAPRAEGAVAKSKRPSRGR